MLGQEPLKQRNAKVDSQIRINVNQWFIIRHGQSSSQFSSASNGLMERDYQGGIGIPDIPLGTHRILAGRRLREVIFGRNVTILS